MTYRSAPPHAIILPGLPSLALNKLSETLRKRFSNPLGAPKNERTSRGGKAGLDVLREGANGAVFHRCTAESMPHDTSCDWLGCSASEVMVSVCECKLYAICSVASV